MGLTKKQKSEKVTADFCRKINPKSEIATQIERKIRRTEMRKGKTR